MPARSAKRNCAGIASGPGLIVGGQNQQDPLLTSTQVIGKKLPSSPIRLGCRRGVVVGASVAREGVIAPRITVDRHIRLVRVFGFDFCLSLFIQPRIIKGT
jgi:hypothetical protein